MTMTMGSLFDGAGTMPFAGSLCGIETQWSSEIEKFPCEVTKKRFPRVKQLGDVTKINGAEIEPVDIITFGSPCQDLSIAGQRAGLKGERSGLFMEAVRIIKEMRNATRNGADEPVRPRYAVWENVPGAYSSNGGEDFRAVLEELCRVADDEVSIPRPPQGRWGGAGAIMGDGYSVAWRTLDAQYWGVPQRRRRIWLVADFGGRRAAEILFEREGMSRNFAEIRKAWTAQSEVESGVADAGDDTAFVYDGRVNGSGRVSPTLAGDHGNRIDYTPLCVRFREGKEGGGKGALVQIGKSGTIACGNDQIVFAIGNGQADQTGLHEICGALNCMHDAQALITIDRAAFSQGANAKYDFDVDDSGIAQTIVARGPGAICDIRKLLPIRRFTPTECARLQGMPDWWCADIPHSDTAEYKMWGNGMALPNALYVMEGIAATSGEEESK